MLEKRLIEIFFELVKIDGLSGKERPVADYITARISELGFPVYEDDSSKFTNSDTGNVICRVGENADLLLTCHMDTARSTQKVNPIFDPENRKITSDGNTVLGVDNRAGVSVLLYLLEKIKKENIKVRDFFLSFVTCEETTLLGSKHLDIDKNVNRIFVFDSYMIPGKFVNSSFGAASFEVELLGRATHSGINPDIGINSIKIAGDAISKIPIGLLENEATLNFGIISGGSAVNVVPEKTVIRGEVRSATTKETEIILNNIKSIFRESAEKYKGKMNFTYNWDFYPYHISQDEQIYKEISEVIAKIGLEPEACMTKGGSDANSFNERGIPAINLGIGAQMPHSNEEFISLNDFQNALDIAINLVKI